MAQEVERRLGKAEATGSNPVSSFRVAIKPRINRKEENSLSLLKTSSLLFCLYAANAATETKRSVVEVPWLYCWWKAKKANVATETKRSVVEVSWLYYWEREKKVECRDRDETKCGRGSVALLLGKRENS